MYIQYNWSTITLGNFLERYVPVILALALYGSVDVVDLLLNFYFFSFLLWIAYLNVLGAGY